MHLKRLSMSLLLSGLFLSVAASAPAAQSTAPAARSAVADKAGHPSGHPPATTSHGTVAEQPPAHWSYQGNDDPAHWGELSSDYAECAKGRNQSPVDLDESASVPARRSTVHVDYQPMRYELENNGHTIQVAPEGRQPPVRIAGHDFVLKQFHFHDPSEHTFKGRHFPLELHLVHESGDGALAVLAVVFEEGEANPALAPLVAEPLAKGQSRELSEPLDIRSLLPAKMTHFRLNGSLTTPPCSEGVNWVVFVHPVAASKAQIEAMARLIGGPNNRPVQPFNARILIEEDS